MTTYTLHCRFHPQAWVNDNAVEVDAEGPTDWHVEVDLDGEVPPDDDYATDEYHTWPAGPDWVRDWTGPFYVEILNRDEIEALLP